MPKFFIDDREVDVEPGDTILEAARKLGIDIPTLCFADGLPPSPSCMVCIVKIKGKEDLVPSRATKAEEGMESETATEEVARARRDQVLLPFYLNDAYHA